MKKEKFFIPFESKYIDDICMCVGPCERNCARNLSVVTMPAGEPYSCACLWTSCVDFKRPRK